MMSVNQQFIYKELQKNNSKRYLDLFFQFEQRYTGDIFPCSYGNYDADIYIWLIDITNDEEKPIGFIGYKLIVLENNEEFIYIVKFYVLGEYKKYRNKNKVILINEERVSKILFNSVISKGKNIITLISANERLDKYYNKTYGFIYNDKISEKFASKVGESSNGFLYLDLKKDIRNIEEQEEMKKLFG